VDKVRRHCELFVEGLEVVRCEQTMALAEVERARVWRGEAKAKVRTDLD
jgi:hypothetical protein